MIKNMIQHAKKHPGIKGDLLLCVCAPLPLVFTLAMTKLMLLRSAHVVFLLYEPIFKLVPQFFFMTLGISGAALYLIRLARGPHVTFWDKKNDPEPWNKLDPTYQYKFVAVNTDYKSLKKDRPDF